MNLVEVLGKKNRKVPVLLTKTMSKAIEALNSVRESVGIDLGNAFVFAVVSNVHNHFLCKNIVHMVKRYTLSPHCVRHER